jgi:hypothetical protein
MLAGKFRSFGFNQYDANSLLFFPRVFWNYYSKGAASYVSKGAFGGLNINMFFGQRLAINLMRGRRRRRPRQFRHKRFFRVVKTRDSNMGKAVTLGALILLVLYKRMPRFFDPKGRDWEVCYIFVTLFKQLRACLEGLRLSVFDFFFFACEKFKAESVFQKKFLKIIKRGTARAVFNFVKRYEIDFMPQLRARVLSKSDEYGFF